MILIDNRVGSKELLPYIQRIGGSYKADLASLEFGDACFEGNGPNGKILIGIERKTMGDMLNCIDDARYSGHQIPGMMSMYNQSLLMVEGVWKPDKDTGYLMECVAMLSWRPFRYRQQMTRYSKLFRYLLSVQLSGVSVIITRDIEQTAYNITECYGYFNKKWEDHTSLLEIQKLNIPTLRAKPPLVQRWAAALEGVGVKHSAEAKKIFKTGMDLARGSEEDWMQISGVGPKLSRSIIKQIHETE